MIINRERLERVLTNLNSAVSELREASQESPTNGTLRAILRGVETSLAILRFYLATNN